MFKDANGVARSVEVCVEGERYRRPIENIIPLELSCEDADNNNNPDGRVPSSLPSDDEREAVGDGGATSNQTTEEDAASHPTLGDDVTTTNDDNGST